MRAASLRSIVATSGGCTSTSAASFTVTVSPLTSTRVAVGGIGARRGDATHAGLQCHHHRTLHGHVDELQPAAANEADVAHGGQDGAGEEAPPERPRQTRARSRPSGEAGRTTTSSSINGASS